MVQTIGKEWNFFSSPFLQTSCQMLCRPFQDMNAREGGYLDCTVNIGHSSTDSGGKKNATTSNATMQNKLKNLMKSKLNLLC